MLTEHYRKLERMYLQANINTMLFDTTTCEISMEKAEIGLTLSKKYYHALGAIHGSVYFKLLDDAAFFAVSSLEKNVFVLTISFTTYITKPVSKGIMRAQGKVVNQNKTQFIAEAVVFDAEGNELGRGNGIFVKSKIPLGTAIGYKGA